MKIVFSTISSIILVMVMAFSPAAHAQAVVNGNFENNPDTPFTTVLAPSFIDPPTNSWRVVDGSINTYVHPCGGVKPAHCSCQTVFGSSVLATVTDHDRCYTQQANTGQNSDCAQWCKGIWAAQGPFYTSTINALKANPNVCGNANVNVQFKAGTNSWANINLYSPVAVNTGGQWLFYLISPSQGCGKNCVR